MARGQVLRILTRQLQVIWNNQTFDFLEREMRLLALLGLIHPEVGAIEGDGWIATDQVAQLEGYSHLKSGSLPNTVRRFVRSLEEQGLKWISSPKGKQLGFFRLDPSVVGSVVFDVELPEVLVWLGLGSSRTVETLPNSALLLAEALFQAGRWGEAEEIAQALIGSPAVRDRAAGALLLLSQIRTIQQRLEEAWQLLGRAEDSAVYDPEGELQALIQIQRARLHRMNGDIDEAESVALSLRRQSRPPGPTVAGRLETLRGLLLLDDPRREPLEARVFFERALQLYAQAQSWWGVQASYANLGLAFYRQALLPASSRAEREDWLQRASGWFCRCHELSGRTGFGYENPDVLTYWAKCRRWLGEWEGQEELLQEALELSSGLGLSRSQAEAMYELGEYRWHQGHIESARETWHKALDLTGEDERQFMQKQIGGRLSLDTPA